MRSALALLCAVLSLAVAPLQTAWAQEPLSEAAAWTAEAAGASRGVPDITYLVADGYELKLDLYLPQASEPVPTLIYIHGGGWVAGSKNQYVLRVLPYVEMGMAVVNVEYRLAKQALAPAAVEDCRCALRWVYRNAEKYNLDTDRIVVTGHSAGGHLALMTGMLTEEAGLDNRCPRGPQEDSLAVAAIINFFGITDVADLLEGAHRRTYAVAWLGSQPNREEIAQRVSPLRYVRPGLPPVLTLHGDSDSIVPYQHAVRLHEALDAAGVPNRLLTIPGADHDNFNAEQTKKAYRVIRTFLQKHEVIK